MMFCFYVMFSVFSAQHQKKTSSLVACRYDVKHPISYKNLTLAKFEGTTRGNNYVLQEKKRINICMYLGPNIRILGPSMYIGFKENLYFALTCKRSRS